MNMSVISSTQEFKGEKLVLDILLTPNPLIFALSHVIL